MKKYHKLTCLIGLAVSVFVAQPPFSLSQTSTNYTIRNDVFDTGGSFSSSVNYQVIDAIGQPEPIGTSAGQEYIESSGFFAGGGGSTGVADEAGRLIPTEFLLCQNYPNPFNPETTIAYHVPAASKVEMKVYNILFEEVTTLVDGMKEAGKYVVRWDGLDRHGRQSACGLYLCRIEAGSYAKTIRMLLLK
jgi:hypothetical protein